MKNLPITWHPRAIPLAPVAVVAQGKAAYRLAKRALARDDATLADLSGIVGRDLIVLLGDAERLPWVDGALYLGQDAAAPNLLLPTTLEPSVPLPLLESALRRQAPELPPPIAAVPGTRSLFSLAAARPIARETLRRWLETNT
jgi:hypothetical protein